jgi:hypothetical protein
MIYRNTIVRSIISGVRDRNLSSFDADAIGYIQAVEAADGQPLPAPVRFAIRDFIVGCKTNGTWNALQAACFLKGPRTLAGALVPLVGPAPTNYNFASGDYAAKTGLKGNATDKRLGSGRNNNADPQNNKHMSAFITEFIDNSNWVFIGSGTTESGASMVAFQSGSNLALNRINRGGSDGSFPGTFKGAGLQGSSRSDAVNIAVWNGTIGTVVAQPSAVPLTTEIMVFCRGTPASPSIHTDSRLGWYSVGGAINLGLLNTRLVAYMAAVDGAVY